MSKNPPGNLLSHSEMTISLPRNKSRLDTVSTEESGPILISGICLPFVIVIIVTCCRCLLRCLGDHVMLWLFNCLPWSMQARNPGKVWYCRSFDVELHAVRTIDRCVAARDCSWVIGHILRSISMVWYLCHMSYISTWQFPTRSGQVVAIC